MINTKAFGVYDISLNGGLSFIHTQKNLILNNYYQKSSLTTSISLAIGSGNTPPQLTDNSLVSEFDLSVVPEGFETSPDQMVFADRFEIKYSRLFDFGTGNTGTIRELGIKNPNLCSRALLTAPDNQPTEVTLLNTDHVVIRYSIIYIIPRASQVFALTINGTPVNATIAAVNGEVGGWGSEVMGEVVRYANIGSGDAGTWSIDVDGNIVGANLTNGVLLTTNVNGISGLTIVGTATVGTDDWNGTFQQLLVTSAGVNFITAPILIDLDVPVTKTNQDIINISLSVNQSV